MSIPVKVTDASVRESVMHANLYFRGEDVNQIGTPLTVEISKAYDGWLAQVRAEARRDALLEAAEDIRPQMRVEMDPSADKDPAASLATANAILHGTADRLRALADKEQGNE